MRKAATITLAIIGSIVGLFILFLIILYVAGGQTVVDPFTSGIDVVDVPYTTPSTVTWRLVGASEGIISILYISTESRPAADGFTPESLGYAKSIAPRVETVDGVQVLRADVPAGKAYVRVYADINGPKWSQEYLMEAS